MSDDKIVKDWVERSRELRTNKHIIDQATRCHKALEAVMGTRDCPTLDETINDLAVGVAMLETNPEAKQVFGMLHITRGPMDGYGVWIRSADVFSIHVWGEEQFAKERGSDA